MECAPNSSSGGVPKIQVFRPTWEEFKDFNNYILQIEKLGAHKAGLAKIVPPPEWKPRADGYDMSVIGEIEIPAPISQVVQGKQGVYQVFNIQKNSMKVKDFMRLANSAKHVTPSHFDYQDLDRKYWRNISYCPPIYGADVSGSLTDPDVEEWNINKLGSILDYVNADYGISIDGVNTAYLYFGMWKSCFAWHTEDMDLYSINYLHFGEPKSWYCVPPEHGARLERLANNFFPANYKECPAYLRHKMSVISPMVLKNHSIPYNKIVQEAGEFMITFPYGYHAGFNHGFNCAESTNFASPRWVEYGKRATQCACRPDMVKISMETFVKRFQPERYDLWVQGKDIGPHPEMPGRLSAAPHPSKDDLLWNKNYTDTDLPESFVEPTKKKAKRHLIHQKLEQEQQQQVNQAEEETANNQEGVAVKSESNEETNVIIEEEDLLNDEHFEVMKEIYYKAGEMESDGLEERKSDQDEQEVWEPDLESPDSKSKVMAKKSIKRSKSKSSAEGHSTKVKYRRTKSETTPRSLSPRSHIGHVAETTTTTAPPVKCAQTTTATPPVKCAQLKTNVMFSGFRIPKKVPSVDNQSVAVCGWTEAENTSTQRTNSSFSCYSTPKVLKEESSSQDVFSKTRIQKPSASSHIKSCPVTAVQLSANSSPLLATPSPAAMKPPSLSASPSKAATHPSSTTDLLRQQLTSIKSVTNKLSPSSSGDERRSRKQKSPRKGLDSRDTSTNLTIMWEQQKDWTWAKECEFNLMSSHQEPYCCVCSVLRPSVPQRPQQQEHLSRSTVLVPENVFGSNRVTITSSLLLRCSSCCVCIHAKCCGLAESTVADNWLCRRCDRNEMDRHKIKCCLCLQRGGALKGTTDGRWAHILCTICLPDVSFGHPELREPIIINPRGWKEYVLLKCVFCSNSRPDSSSNYVTWHRGICLPCVKQCGRAFHPMCGLVNGVRFTVSQDGSRLSANCCSLIYSPRSTTTSFSTSAVGKKKVPVNVSLGQQVYAKHPATGEYRLAVVTDNTQTVTYYSVDFNDGTSSQDTYPEDIRNYNCKEDGPPPEGAAVDVMWTDGKSYDGFYRGRTNRKLYSLSFCEDRDTVITAERCEFYHPDEDLPEDLKNQMDKQRAVASAAQMDRLHTCSGIQP